MITIIRTDHGIRTIRHMIPGIFSTVIFSMISSTMILLTITAFMIMMERPLRILPGMIQEAATAQVRATTAAITVTTGIRTIHGIPQIRGILTIQAGIPTGDGEEI